MIESLAKELPPDKRLLVPGPNPPVYLSPGRENGKVEFAFKTPLTKCLGTLCVREAWIFVKQLDC